VAEARKEEKRTFAGPSACPGEHAHDVTSLVILKHEWFLHTFEGTVFCSEQISLKPVQAFTTCPWQGAGNRTGHSCEGDWAPGGSGLQVTI